MSKHRFFVRRSILVLALALVVLALYPPPVARAAGVTYTKYKILIKQNTTNGPKVYSATVNVSQNTTTALPRQQSFYLRVSAINSAGKTKSDWIQFTTQ